jgi:hypothetical protein
LVTVPARETLALRLGDACLPSAAVEILQHRTGVVSFIGDDFRIVRHARGNRLRLDVVFPGGKGMAFNEYDQSFSYDGKSWFPLPWETGTAGGAQLNDTLLFPTFMADQVFVGTQVPLSHEDALALIDEWKANPHVRVHVVGKTMGGRDMHRIEITDAASPHPRARRWTHYFANQHPGEHNSQWRLVGMVRWLLSDAATDFRQRNIVHVILMMSPDSPSRGWYRVNAQGVDMNRSYRPQGSDAKQQAHEAYLWQRDFHAAEHPAQPGAVPDAAESFRQARRLPTGPRRAGAALRRGTAY